MSTYAPLIAMSMDLTCKRCHLDSCRLMVLTLQIQQKSQVKFKSKKSWAQGYSFLTACLSQYQRTKRSLSRFNVYQIITIVTIMSLFLQLSDIQLTQILIDITQLITKIYINMIIVLCKKYDFFPLGGIICVVLNIWSKLKL